MSLINRKNTFRQKKIENKRIRQAAGEIRPREKEEEAQGNTERRRIDFPPLPLNAECECRFETSAYF